MKRTVKDSKSTPFLDKELTMHTLVCLVLFQYSMNSFSCSPDLSCDTDLSCEMSFLLTELKKHGATLDEIDNAIACHDFTNLLTHYGSGDRERGYVMEYIEEVWNSI